MKSMKGPGAGNVADDVAKAGTKTGTTAAKNSRKKWWNAWKSRKFLWGYRG